MDDLIERALRGEATDEELARLADWRRASPNHERQYAQVGRLVRAALRLGERSPDIATPDSNLIVATAKAHERTSVWRRALPWAIAAVALLVAGTSFTEMSRATRAKTWGAARVVTGAAEITTVELRDGSVVRLGPSSRLDISTHSDAREVTLRGRAFFAVAPDSQHPFRVRTAMGEAQVLGTRFELVAEEERLDLVVVEGKVALTAQGDRIEVRGGERGGVVYGRLTLPLRIASPDSLPQWVGRFAVFQKTPLGEVVREIARIYDVMVVVEDAALASETVTATFTDQAADQVVAVICSAVGARCDKRGSSFVMRR